MREYIMCSSLDDNGVDDRYDVIADESEVLGDSWDDDFVNNVKQIQRKLKLDRLKEVIS
jgi:hypothetical protein